MEQAVIVHIRFENSEADSSEQLESILVLENCLTKAIEEINVGEFDGDEAGQGEVTLYMYGPDANRLFATVEPLLRASGFEGYAIKRFGGAGDLKAPEVRVAW
jgi:hypothetical protein